MNRDPRQQLADSLVSNGSVTSAWLRTAFAVVARDIFVPRFYTWCDDRSMLVDRDDPATREQWRVAIYTDAALTTQLTPSAGITDPAGLPTSSSSMPSVMAGMLEALDLEPGHRVLEIGTGTGYNAAILCHRVGAENVTTTELHPVIAEAARTALASIGDKPTIIVGDAATLPHDIEYFDRIIATAAIDHVPPAWIDCLAPNGVLVANLRGSLSGGIVKLAKDEPEAASGTFLPMRGSFMPMRQNVDAALQDDDEWSVSFDHTNSYRGLTTIEPRLVAENPSLRFFIQLHLAKSYLRGFILSPQDVRLSGVANDGSWFEVDLMSTDDRHHTVAQAGPRRLWDTVEHATNVWNELDRPTVTRFGVSASNSRSTQYVWLDHRDSLRRWPLPL